MRVAGRLRPAGQGDVPFLVRMLAEAVDWRPGTQVRPAAAVLEQPELAHYVTGWPAPGERGVLAEDGAGGAVGAAWWRLLTAADPGYGFVRDGVPEVSVAVIAAHRGRGVGTALLRALVDQAREQALPALSLSVEPDNPALRLYRRLGFAPAGGSGGSLTMLLTLDG